MMVHRQIRTGALALLVAAATLASWALQPVAAQSLPLSGGSQAEAEIALPDPLTPAAIRELVSRLSDADVRQLLLTQLDASAKPEPGATSGETIGMLEFLQSAAIGVGTSVATAVARVPLLWSGQMESFGNFFRTRGVGGTLEFLGAIFGAIAAGLAVEFLISRLVSARRARIDRMHAPESLRGSLRMLGMRLFFDLVGLAAFFATTKTLIVTFASPDDLIVIPTIMVNLVVFPRLMAALSRFLLAPQRPELRIVHTDDASAIYLHRHMIGLVVVMGFSIALVQFNAMNGVPMGETRLGFWLNLAAHVYLCYIVIQAREGLAMMLMGSDGDVTPLEARIARAYPWFAFWLSIVTWLVVEIIVSQEMFHLLTGGRHFLTMILLLMAPALDTLVRTLVHHLTGPMTGKGELAETAYVHTKQCYVRIGRVMVFAVVIIVIAIIWDLDFTTMASASLGAALAGRLFELMLIVALAYLALELVGLWVNRQLAAEMTTAAEPGNDEAGGGEGGGQGGSRLSTVLPLVNGVARVAIVVVFGLIALGNIGIDITPLLAGAGIAGLAIGFGAQKLVADIVSGVFFLFDDAFRTGEYVDIDGTVGTVEKISIRSMQLRHHRGAVHTIPYGEIPKITNYSRDWVIMKLKFTVPFHTDINKVKKIFKQIGAEISAEPAFADDLLQPFKSQGVLDVDDVGIVLRGKFMAKPGKQFTLRKEIYQRVKDAFAAAGIEFARREVHVAIPGLDGAKNLSDDQKEAIETAAAAAAAAPGTEPQPAR